MRVGGEAGREGGGGRGRGGGGGGETRGCSRNMRDLSQFSQ